MLRLLYHTALLLPKKPGWLMRGVRAMEYDAHTQWRYHLFMSWFWIFTIFPILVLFFCYPQGWLRWGVFITLVYSLYANWVSDFGAMHAAWAALRGDEITAKTDMLTAQVEKNGDELHAIHEER